MKRHASTLCALVLGFALTAGGSMASAWSDEGHGHGATDQKEMLEMMKKMHGGHEHGHDFAAMEAMSTEDMGRVMGLMMDIGLALPPMDSHRGRELFLEKGCVVCHAVNEVGGAVGPSLDAAEMPQPMSAFEFAARMWRGAPAMAQMQQDLLGQVIDLNGQDLADLVAFAHDETEQRELTTSQIPARYRELISQ
ncbi:MAG: cytochrome c [Rhodospirillales bacterium]|nr:cytochrome c [Rhodospirillales bacterium]